MNNVRCEAKHTDCIKNNFLFILSPYLFCCLQVCPEINLCDESSIKKYCAFAGKITKHIIFRKEQLQMTENSRTCLKHRSIYLVGLTWTFIAIFLNLSSLCVFVNGFINAFLLEECTAFTAAL